MMLCKLSFQVQSRNEFALKISVLSHSRASSFDVQTDSNFKQCISVVCVSLCHPVHISALEGVTQADHPGLRLRGHETFRCEVNAFAVRNSVKFEIPQLRF